MINPIREYVKSLDQETLSKLFLEGEEWEKNMSIPHDALLRIASEETMRDGSSITAIMFVLHEVWRELYVRSNVA